MIAYRDGHDWIFRLTSLECDQLIAVLSRGTAYWIKKATLDPSMVEVVKGVVELKFKFGESFVKDNYEGPFTKDNPIVLMEIDKSTVDRGYEDCKNGFFVKELNFKSEKEMFINKHGPKKFYEFETLYEKYEKGETTSQLMVKELGVTRYEVEVLLNYMNLLKAEKKEIQ